MVTKISAPEYLDKVKLLTEEEAERLLSRMAGKLPRRLEKDKLSRDEALAIQMELEDEQLQEWRNRMHTIKAKESSDKAAAKAKADNAPEKSKAQSATKAALKAKPKTKKRRP